MARQTMLILLAIAFCLQSTGAIEFLWGKNATYNELCPDEQEYATAALPDICNLTSYIMCSKGQAIAVNNCPRPLLFNSTLSRCDHPENVAIPLECDNNTKIIGPPTCDGGFQYVPVEGSCKNYTWCLPNGSEVDMVCPVLSYYVHVKQKCLYIYPPYVLEIPKDFLDGCFEKDPYTPAPTTPTAAPPVPAVPSA